MQVNNIQSNDTSFGAKLVINDCEGLLRGINRPYRISNTKKFRTFSEQELRQIEDIFAQKTKNITGKIELRPGWYYDRYGGEEVTRLLYFPNKKSTLEQIKKNVFSRVERKYFEDAPVIIFKKKLMSKSAEGIADTFIGALFAMKHRFAQTQQVFRLESKIRKLESTRTNDIISELGKYSIKIVDKDYL